MRLARLQKVVSHVTMCFGALLVHPPSNGTNCPCKQATGGGKSGPVETRLTRLAARPCMVLNIHRPVMVTGMILKCPDLNLCNKQDLPTEFVPE